MVDLGHFDLGQFDLGQFDLGQFDSGQFGCPLFVKSTSPVTENHYKNGYVNYNIYKNFIMTNVDNNRDTKYTINNDTNNHDTRNLHK